MIDASIPGHWFHVCRPDRDPATYVVQFDDDAFLQYIPVARVSQAAPADLLRNLPACIVRQPVPVIGLSERQALVFSKIDGVRDVRQCLAAAGAPPDAPEAVPFARQFFGFLWRIGYAMFRLP